MKPSALSKVLNFTIGISADIPAQSEIKKINFFEYCDPIYTKDQGNRYLKLKVFHVSYV